MVLPYVDVNPPRVYMCPPSWTPLPPPSPCHPSGSSQCTSPEHPASCIEPGLGGSTCILSYVKQIASPHKFEKEFDSFLKISSEMLTKITLYTSILRKCISLHYLSSDPWTWYIISIYLDNQFFSEMLGILQILLDLSLKIWSFWYYCKLCCVFTFILCLLLIHRNVIGFHIMTSYPANVVSVLLNSLVNFRNL